MTIEGTVLVVQVHREGSPNVLGITTETFPKAGHFKCVLREK